MPPTLPLARDTSTADLLAAVLKVSERLLATKPDLAVTEAHANDWYTDDSETVTGYHGVRVLVYMEGADGFGFGFGYLLQVDGPERLIEAVIKHYRGRLTPAWLGRSDGHAVFEVQY